MPLTVQQFPVGSLNPYHRNPRRGVVSAIADSLRVRGQYRPIVVNVGTLTGRPLEVLAGNHTLQAAMSLGWGEIEATTVDVDDDGATQIVLADNRLADLGSYDDAALVELLQSLDSLDGTGYSDTDLAGLLRDLEEPGALTDPDHVPEVPETPVSVLGDLWELGPHRLLVGDSTDTQSVRWALGEGRDADCVWTDPPYGVEVVGGFRGMPIAQRRANGGGTIRNDGAAGAADVIVGAMGTIAEVARPGCPVYIAHGDKQRPQIESAMEAVGIEFRQLLVWVKDFVLSQSDYHSRCEQIIYGFTEPLKGSGRLGRGGSHWFGTDNATTVFEVPKPQRSEQHPTMKPVELIAAMLRNSCPPGGTVLDLFGGSGSTMIAAHQLGQRAVLVELDPKYADVICRRWQEHTGVVPVRGGEPVSFV